MDEAVPSDIYEILRLPLRSSAELVSTLDASDPEHLRRIIKEILWHRWFIATYYLVLIAVIAVFWIVRIVESVSNKRRRAAEAGEPLLHGIPETVTSSSSSSTLQGSDSDDTPKKHVEVRDAERIPLLSEHGIPPRSPPSLYRRLVAFLLYQPRPVPALTSRTNVLPSNGTTLLILLLLAINLFYLLYRTPLCLEYIFIIGDRAGLLFSANLPVLYLLAAKTNQPLKLLTGWSYEGLNLFHRRLGEWMMVFSIIHMLSMFTVWYTILIPLLDFTLWQYLCSPTVYLGIIAVLAYYTIYWTSTGWFRQLYYETFLALHIFCQAAALGFLFFHYPTTAPYVTATILIWLVDRICWRMTLSSRRFIATLSVAPDERTVLVHMTIPLRKSYFGIRFSLRNGWEPGQHLFLTVPSMSLAHKFQTHPFTIASAAPPSQENIASWPLQLTIRAIDGFSLDLLNYARHHQHIEVILDGPHGGTEALEAARHADRVCFVAGGSGIAVTYPLAWDVSVAQAREADAIVDARLRYEDGVRVAALEGVIESRTTRNFAHFWVRQDERHARWLTMFPKLESLRSRDAVMGDSAVKVHGAEQPASLITQTFDTRKPGPDGGRPDMKGEITDWVRSSEGVGTPSSSSSSSTAASTQAQKVNALMLNQRRKEKIAVVVSGPDGLVRDVRNICADLLRDGWDISVWVEKFGW